MIVIIVDFTEAELKEIDELETKYEKIFAELDEIINRREDMPDPRIHASTEELLDKLRAQYSREDMPEAVVQAVQNGDERDRVSELQSLWNLWEQQGSAEWKEARKRRAEAQRELMAGRNALISRAEQRHFDELGGDPEKIIADAADQAEKLINGSISYHKKTFDESGFLASGVIKAPDGLKLDQKEIRAHIVSSLKLYVDFVSNDSKLTNRLFTAIDRVLKKSPYVLQGTKDPEALVKSKYPQQYITPTDKITSLAFAGELAPQMGDFRMERYGSKKQITTMASIDFEAVNNSVQIRGRKELNAYDREVHDAIVTLYVDGKNEYITPQMIYQTMTGDPKARLSPKQAEAISDSITKCLYSRVTIDAKEEAAAYGFDKLKYDGSLISGERVTASLNGNIAECLHILKLPILYEYADKKNQVGRFDIKLLNSPINKNEEAITMQGYLYRRILSMKGSKLSHTILYDKIYNQIGVEAASQGALRKKKNKVRDRVREVLDFWTENGFIKGYSENKLKTEFYSVTINL